MTFLDFARSFSSGLIVLPVIQFVQSVSIAKAFGKVYNYEIDSTSELVALSCANMFGAFFGGWPVTGSFSGSAVNAMSGTQTPFSSVIACGLVFLAVGFLMPCFYYIPKTVLGAMIVMAVVTMIDTKTPMMIWKIRKIDLLPYLVSFFGTFYTLETGVLAGAVVSLLIMVSLEISPVNETIKHGDNHTITIIFKGNLSYPAIEYIKETVNNHVQQHGNLQTINMNMEHVYRFDYPILNCLRDLVHELQQDGISVEFVNFADSEAKESFERSKLNCKDEEKECLAINKEDDRRGGDDNEQERTNLLDDITKDKEKGRFEDGSKEEEKEKVRETAVINNIKNAVSEKEDCEFNDIEDQGNIFLFESTTEDSESEPHTDDSKQEDEEDLVGNT